MNKQTTNIIHGPLYQDSFFSIARKEKKKHESVKGFIFFQMWVCGFFSKTKCVFISINLFFSLIYYFDFSFFIFHFSYIFFTFLFFSFGVSMTFESLGRKKEGKKKRWRKYERMEEKKGFFFFVLSVLISFLFPFWMVISFSFYLVRQAKESTGEQDQGFF